MAKNDPFASLMTIAQDQQGYFTTKQAIEAGYADNTHPFTMSAPEIGNESLVEFTAWLISHRQKTGK